MRVSVVYVLNMRGEPLMPTTPRKARKLLEKGEAHVVKRTPFVIQMNKATGETKQEVILGVDTGYKTVGLSATSRNKELYSDEVTLRNDIVKLLSDRRMFRKNKRNRKHWYRPARFLNRKNRLGKLPSSIQHKLDSHIKLVQQASKFLPISNVIIEVADFDIQKIKNPDISGKKYQEGDQLGFENVRQYVLHRDNHQCQYCKKKKCKLQIHHIISHKTGGDRPDNLITLCKDCHIKHHEGLIELKIKKTKGFKAETFMSILKNRLASELRKLGFNIGETYGYITKYNRKKLGLEKSHRNDAFVISEGSTQTRCQQYISKFMRKQNRKLFKGARSHIKNTCPRYVLGFQRFDKIKYEGIECFIFGRRSSGFFDIKKLNEQSISHNCNYKKILTLESGSTLLREISYL